MLYCYYCYHYWYSFHNTRYSLLSVSVAVVQDSNYCHRY
jgi:hypothetical protein